MLLALALMQLVAVQLPLPYVEHCAWTQDPACKVDRMTVEELAALHRLISEANAPDLRPGVGEPLDPWRVFPADRMMDCDDMVISERMALQAFGVPAGAMSIVAGEVTEPDGATVGHVVLVVEIDGKRWVLDRKVPQSVYSDGKRPYPWRQSATQAHDSILWRPGERK